MDLKTFIQCAQIIGSSPDHCLNGGRCIQLKLMEVIGGNSYSLHGSRGDFYEASITRVVFLVKCLILLEVKKSNVKLPYIKLYLIYLGQKLVFSFIPTNLKISVITSSTTDANFSDNKRKDYHVKSAHK